MSRFESLYQDGKEKRQRMEARQKNKMEKKDPSCTFFPVTNNPSNRDTTIHVETIGPTTRPGPPCTTDLIVQAILNAMSSKNTNKFAEYTQVLTKILAPIIVPAPPSQKIKKSSRASSRASDERFQSLYDDSVQRRKAKRVRQEEESKKKLSGLFAPKINRIKGNTVDDQGKDGRFGRLYKDAELRKKRLDKSLQEKKQSTIKHSFTPKINKYTSDTTSHSRGSRFDQLYADGKRKRNERKKEIKERREEVKRLKEEEERIVKTTKREKTKQKRFKKTKQQRPESDTLKSKPSKMSKVRQKAMDKKKDDAMKPRKKKKKKKFKLSAPPTLPGAYSKEAVAKYRARLEAHRQSNECTFSPKVNRRSKQEDGDSSVFDRLNQSTKLKYERIKQRENQLPHHCSFKPSINPGPTREGTVFSRLDQDSKNKNR